MKIPSVVSSTVVLYAHTFTQHCLVEIWEEEKRQAQKELERLEIRKRGPKSGKGPESYLLFLAQF